MQSNPTRPCNLSTVLNDDLQSIFRFLIEIRVIVAGNPNLVLAIISRYNLFLNLTYQEKEEALGMDSTILRPTRARIFRCAWILILILFIIFTGIRYYGLFGLTDTRMLVMLSYILMWFLPFIFYTTGYIGLHRDCNWPGYQVRCGL